MNFKSALFLIASASVASAQTGCKTDILIDDFTNVRKGLIDMSRTENVNLLGGGYEGQNVEMSFSQAVAGVPGSGKVTVVPTSNNRNWFTFSLDPSACFNVGDYSSLIMTVKFPPIAGSGGKFALGVCGRIPIVEGGWVQKNVTEYMVAHGGFQTLRIPIADFRQSSLKHIQFTDMPVGGSYEFYNIRLAGNCRNSGQPLVPHDLAPLFGGQQPSSSIRPDGSNRPTPVVDPISAVDPTRGATATPNAPNGNIINASGTSTQASSASKMVASALMLGIISFLMM